MAKKNETLDEVEATGVRLVLKGDGRSRSADAQR